MSKGEIIGETRILSQKSEEAECEWQIPKLTSLSAIAGHNYFSPKLRIWNTVWIMRIFPHGLVEDCDWIKLELGRNRLERNVFYSVVINTAQRKHSVQKTFDCGLYNGNAYIRSIKIYCPLKPYVNLRSLFATSDPLTVKLSLHRESIPFLISQRINDKVGVVYDWSYSKDDWDFSEVDNPTASRDREDNRLDSKAERFISRETQTEESLDVLCSETAGDTKSDSPLRRHLQNLLIAGDDHDIILKVKDQEFKAHKCILRSRSPVFAAMFKHKMKESEGGPILIEDCDPNAFGDFLVFIYTEKVEDLSPSKAMGLYYTADKYDFSELKKICVEYLKASLSTTVICDVISMATIHGENGLLECAINFFSKNVEAIVTTVEWQRFGEKNFVAANELYIKALERRK